jgi:hypothetical protein
MEKLRNGEVHNLRKERWRTWEVVEDISWGLMHLVLEGWGEGAWCTTLQILEICGDIPGQRSMWACFWSGSNLRPVDRLPCLAAYTRRGRGKGGGGAEPKLHSPQQVGPIEPPWSLGQATPSGSPVWGHFHPALRGKAGWPSLWTRSLWCRHKWESRGWWIRSRDPKGASRTIPPELMAADSVRMEVDRGNNNNMKSPW